MARDVVEGLRVGIHKSPLRGFSTEFAHHRPYVPGDTIRHVDWRVYGRTERYYVKLYEAETNFDANLLLDGSTSMHYASEGLSKLEYAKRLAAAMAYLVVHQRDSAGLGVFDGELRAYIRPKSSASIVGNIAEELMKVQPQPRTNVAGILHEFARRIPRKGFVILFSDLLDNVEQFVQGIEHLRFRGHNVVVFHVLDPYELTFPFDGTRKFKGLENEPHLITQPRRIRDAYLEVLKDYLRQIRQACERAQVDYVLVDTSRPVEVTLSAFLIGRIYSRV